MSQSSDRWYPILRRERSMPAEHNHLLRRRRRQKVGSLSMSRLVTEVETSVLVVSISGASVVTSTLSVDPADI